MRGRRGWKTTETKFPFFKEKKEPHEENSSCFIAFNNRTKMRENKINNTTRKVEGTWKIFPPWAALSHSPKVRGSVEILRGNSCMLRPWATATEGTVFKIELDTERLQTLDRGRKTLKASPSRLIDFPLWFAAQSFSAGKSEEKEKIWKVILTLLQRNFHDDTRAQPSFYVEGKFSTSASVHFPRVFQGNSSSADADCGKRREISSRKNIENSERGKLLTCIAEFPF